MFIIFLLFPFVAFLLSMRDLDKKRNALIFILFCGLFGYGQHFGLETSDIYRKGLGFELADTSRNVISEYIDGYIPDLYGALTGVLIRQFTENPKVYIGILGLIFGILCYNFYKYIYRNWTAPKRGVFYLLVLLAMTNISLASFTGIRNATASMLFLCSAYRYIYCGKKQWVVGMLLATLIHFHIWAVIAVAAVYMLMPKFVAHWHKICKAALVAAFAISLIDMSGTFNSLVEENEDEIYNSAIANKAGNYTNGSGPEFRDGDSLYRQANQTFFNAYNYINRFGILMVMWLLLNYMRSHTLGDSENRLFLFLFLLAVATIAYHSINSDLGGRTSNIWWELLYVFLARLYSLDRSIPIKKWVLFVLFVNFHNIAFTFYNTPRFVEPSFWISPVPATIVSGWDFYIGLF